MKFYKINQHDIFKDYPKMIKFTDTISHKDTKEGNLTNMPRRSVVEIENYDATQYADFIFRPFFCLSAKAKTIFDMYCKNNQYRQIVLFDRKSNKSTPYYIPILKRKNVDKAYDNKYNMLNQSDLDIMFLFQIHYDGKFEIVARLDLLESFLKQKTRGLYPTEIVFEKGVVYCD